MLLDEVVDEVSRLLVLKLPFADAGARKKLLQLRVNVFEVEASVRIPPDVADVLEVGRQADVLLLQPRFLVAFLLLVEVEVGRLVGQDQSVVGADNRRRRRKADVVGDAGAGRRRRRRFALRSAVGVADAVAFDGRPAFASMPPFAQLVLDDLLELSRLRLIGKVEPHLTVVRLKRVEIRPRGLVPELVVDLLIEDDDPSIHVDDSDEVRPPGVVLDEAGHAARSFVPSGMSWSLGSVNLHDRRGQGGAPRSQKLRDRLIFFVGEKSRRRGRLHPSLAAHLQRRQRPLELIFLPDDEF